MEKDEQQYNCDLCEDTGVVTTFEPIESDSPNLAPVAERICDCQLGEEDWRVNE